MKCGYWHQNVCLLGMLLQVTNSQSVRRQAEGLEWAQTCILHHLCLVTIRMKKLELFQLMNLLRMQMDLLEFFLVIYIYIYILAIISEPYNYAFLLIYLNSIFNVEHKFEIVKRLQDKKHIVGMTGDGVNDAPALKKADIGIAVADSTDAARSASDIVLTEPGLSVIISAVLTSRAIFQRMKNYTVKKKRISLYMQKEVKLPSLPSSFSFCVLFFILPDICSIYHNTYSGEFSLCFSPFCHSTRKEKTNNV